MKEIKLPVSTTVSMNLNTQDLSSKNIEEIDGRRVVQIASIDVGEKSKLIDTARANGGKILYATTSIEKKLETIISNYMFGLFLAPNPPRSFFENEILGSSRMGLSFKKELVKKLVNKENWLKGKKKNNLEKKLANIVKWRNAFAHGTLQYDNDKGTLLNYYANGPKRLTLNDGFWDRVVKDFEYCSSTLDEVSDLIGKKCIDNLQQENIL